MDSYLQHWGLKGMHWGHRRWQNEDGTFNEAGKIRYFGKSNKKNVDKSDINGYNNTKPILSDEQKRAIKIGATVAISALAIYGGYKLAKSGKIKELSSIGKERVDSLLKSGDAPDELNGIKKLKVPESMEDTLKNTNPLNGTPEGRNNCTNCAVTAFMRRQGYDVSALGTGGVGQNLGGVVEDCFADAKVYDGSATTFGKSREHAANMLKRKFGGNAEGVCGVKWRNRPDGHAFNWLIKDGNVQFYDGQRGYDDAIVSQHYWNMIDPNGSFQMARLDNLKPKFDRIVNYMK